MIRLTLRIENIYEDGETVITTPTVTVPAAPEDPEDWDHWAEDHLYPLTGTGQPEGDAGYFIEVTESPDYPALIGAEFEYGT